MQEKMLIYQLQVNITHFCYNLIYYFLKFLFQTHMKKLLSYIERHHFSRYTGIYTLHNVSVVYLISMWASTMIVSSERVLLNLIANLVTNTSSLSGLYTVYISIHLSLSFMQKSIILSRLGLLRPCR